MSTNLRCKETPELELHSKTTTAGWQTSWPKQKKKKERKIKRKHTKAEEFKQTERPSGKQQTPAVLRLQSPQSLVSPFQIPLVKQNCPASTRSKRGRNCSVRQTDGQTDGSLLLLLSRDESWCVVCASFCRLPGQYLPSCDEEGYYRSHQCHSSSGQCWCVDRYGNEVAGSRTHGPANCGEQSEAVSYFVLENWNRLQTPVAFLCIIPQATVCWNQNRKRVTLWSCKVKKIWLLLVICVHQTEHW